MKWIATTLLAAGAVLAAAHVEARKAGGSARLQSDRIDIAYGDPESAANRPAYQLLKEHRVLEKTRDLLSPLRLPHRLLLPRPPALARFAPARAPARVSLPCRRVAPFAR